MKREEHTALIQDLKKTVEGEKVDVAHVTEILATLSEDYGIELANKDQAILKAEKLANDNNNLLRVNNDLFLKVGVQKTENSTDNNGGSNEQPSLKFEDLFNEKGGLK